MTEDRVLTYEDIRQAVDALKWPAPRPVFVLQPYMLAYHEDIKQYFAGCRFAASELWRERWQALGFELMDKERVKG